MNNPFEDNPFAEETSAPTFNPFNLGVQPNQPTFDPNPPQGTPFDSNPSQGTPFDSNQSSFSTQSPQGTPFDTNQSSFNSFDSPVSFTTFGVDWKETSFADFASQSFDDANFIVFSNPKEESKSNTPKLSKSQSSLASSTSSNNLFDTLLAEQFNQLDINPGLSSIQSNTSSNKKTRNILIFIWKLIFFKRMNHKK